MGFKKSGIDRKDAFVLDSTINSREKYGTPLQKQAPSITENNNVARRAQTNFMKTLVGDSNLRRQQNNQVNNDELSQKLESEFLPKLKKITRRLKKQKTLSDSYSHSSRTDNPNYLSNHTSNEIQNFTISKSGSDRDMESSSGKGRSLVIKQSEGDLPESKINIKSQIRTKCLDEISERSKVDEESPYDMSRTFKFNVDEALQLTSNHKTKISSEYSDQDIIAGILIS